MMLSKRCQEAKDTTADACNRGMGGRQLIGPSYLDKDSFRVLTVTSKFQFPLGGSSVTMELLVMSQQMVRLSFPLLSISVGSLMFQAMDSTPCNTDGNV